MNLKDEDITDDVIESRDVEEDEELEATRILNGVDKKSNIKEYKLKLTNKQSVDFLKNVLNKFEIRGEELYLLKIAIEHILVEREADKKRIKELETKQKAMCEEYCPKTERIKELEEENLRLKGRIDVTNWQEKTVYESLKEKYIPIQKVKDKIEEYKKQKDKYESEIQEVFKNNYYHGKILELTHKIWGLEEILEDK